MLSKLIYFDQKIKKQKLTYQKNIYIFVAMTTGIFIHNSNKSLNVFFFYC